MLRTALKYLLALSLILQGSVGVLASPAPHCDHVAAAGSAHHPSPQKPCCPQQVCVANCAMCGAAFVAPSAAVAIVPVTQEIVRDELRLPERSRTDSPPIRPPIA